MANIKSFIHGNAIVAEQVGSDFFYEFTDRKHSDIVGNPQGWGKSYSGKAGKNVWFHAPVPSPAVVSSVRVQLTDVFVFFYTEGDCYMSDLHVWDGGYVINQVASLHTSGDNSSDPILGVNSFSVREDTSGAIHTMNFGLNISMLINFVADSSYVEFSSVGASFIVSD